MSYCQRKHKHYRHPKPNATQTPQERRTKYMLIKTLTGNTKLAQIGRDFRTPKMAQLISNHLKHHGA